MSFPARRMPYPWRKVPDATRHGADVGSSTRVAYYLTAGVAGYLPALHSEPRAKHDRHAQELRWCNVGTAMPWLLPFDLSSLAVYVSQTRSCAANPRVNGGWVPDPAGRRGWQTMGVPILPRQLKTVIGAGVICGVDISQCGAVH